MFLPRTRNFDLLKTTCEFHTLIGLSRQREKEERENLINFPFNDIRQLLISFINCNYMFNVGHGHFYKLRRTFPDACNYNQSSLIHHS